MKGHAAMVVFLKEPIYFSGVFVKVGFGGPQDMFVSEYLVNCRCCAIRIQRCHQDSTSSCYQDPTF